MPQKIADGAAIAHGLELVDEFTKARGEKLMSDVPVLSDAWRGDIMPKEFLPAQPELFVH